MISKLDFVAVPSTDAERSRSFYLETLGLRPDDHGRFEFWVGDTCFGIWEPGKMGREFAPQKNGHLALHVGPFPCQLQPPKLHDAIGGDQNRGGRLRCNFGDQPGLLCT